MDKLNYLDMQPSQNSQIVLRHSGLFVGKAKHLQLFASYLAIVTILLAPINVPMAAEQEVINPNGILSWFYRDKKKSCVNRCAAESGIKAICGVVTGWLFGVSISCGNASLSACVDKCSNEGNVCKPSFGSGPTAAMFSTVIGIGDNGPNLPHGFGYYDLMSTEDKIVVLDFNGDRKDDVLIYRPGHGAIALLRSGGGGKFTTVYLSAEGGSGFLNYDLASTADRIVALDFNGDSRTDLLMYRPGRGAIAVFESKGDGTFINRYLVGDNGSAEPNGIAGYDLMNTYDKIVPFDYDGDRKSDLILYRPGRGAIAIARSLGNGLFSSVYFSADGGSGIAGYDLKSQDDRIAPFDFNGDQRSDLVLYRPGAGKISVLKSNGDGNFTPVTNSVGRLFDYDLRDIKDQVLPINFNIDNKSDLLFYRPGSKIAYIYRSEGDGRFTLMYASGTGMGSYDLASAADQIRPLDYDGDRRTDLFLYRPGQGTSYLLRSLGAGQYQTAYAVGDNGCLSPNGIGGYDFLSPLDQAIALDENGDGKSDLLFFRPGRGAFWLLEAR